MQFRWSPLVDTSSSIREEILQQIFNDWIGNRNGWQLVGTPSCLLARGGVNQAGRIPLDGYSFTPDVFWNDDLSTVVELKRSAKYEEISLVEVLHHAWELARPAETWHTIPFAGHRLFLQLVDAIRSQLSVLARPSPGSNPLRRGYISYAGRWLSIFVAPRTVRRMDQDNVTSSCRPRSLAQRSRTVVCN